MGVKFFGQFLIAHNHVLADDLRKALQMMEERKKSFCALGIEAGHLSLEQGERLVELEKTCILTASQIAIDEGMLPVEVVEDLVEEERKSRIKIGEALIEIGALKDENHLASLLESFHVEQAEYDFADLNLPGGLAGHILAEYVADFVPKLAEKVSSIKLKIDYQEPVEAASYEVVASLVVYGESALRVHLSSDRIFARDLFYGLTACLQEADLEALQAALAEFLNIVLGNAIAALERHDITAELDTPVLGISEYGKEMTYFSLASTNGKATLGLEPL
ncbi:MAG: hypothetical protein VYA34_14205 [Myxococcota bacterium]|nr:hypothetical protein [Myxococcota bacterium]